MDKLKLYVADVDAVHVQNIRKSVALSGMAAVAGSCGDGRLALEQIEALRPDVVISDMQLPRLEGLVLLRTMQQFSEPPACIMCTRFYSDILVDSAYQGGAAYVLFKPIDYSRLPRIIEVCHRDRRRQVSSPRPEHQRRACLTLVRELLSRVGIPCNLAAGIYLSESLVRLSENRTLLRNLSKGLYAEIAAPLHTTPERIERSLRSAIQAAFDHGALSECFSARPTNKEFIEFLLRKLEE